MTNYVITFQDGAIDELMSVILLNTMPDIDCSSIVIVNADCLAEPTYEATVKILEMLGKPSDGVWVSTARGWNPFPWPYRQYAMMVNLLPMINQYGAASKDDYSEVPTDSSTLYQRIQNIKQTDDDAQITLLCLCPLTPIADLVSLFPDIVSAIDSIVWMGGVYTPAGSTTPFPGNIDTGIAPGANPNAEWNAYWDPFAVQTILESGINLNVFPLNVTNNAFLTPEIIRNYFIAESNNYPMLDLAAQMYSMVAFQAGFSFWDTITTAYIGMPSLFEMTPMNISINTSSNPTKQGTISLNASGFPVNMATAITDVNQFYSYFVSQLKTISISCWPPGVT